MTRTKFHKPRKPFDTRKSKTSKETVAAAGTGHGPQAYRAAGAVIPPLTPANLAIRATEDSPTPWIPYAWLRLLNRKLVELAKAREAFAQTGRVTGIHFLIVMAPVRSGKSELGSVFFPAWWLGTFPDDRVILTGNNAELAEGFSRRVRNLLRDHGRRLFGTDIRVSMDSSSAARWDLAAPNRGGLVAVGVGSPPTGKGAHLLVVDDPIKSDMQAYSEAWRESLWRWWLFSIRSRLEPGGVCVIIMSRWHDNDLVGRLLDRQAEADRAEELRRNDQQMELTEEDLELQQRDQTIEDVVDRWEVLHLPALAEPTPEKPDPLGRQPGQALVPERYDEAALLRLRDGPLGVGPVAFQALFQNNPHPSEGTVFKVEHFKYMPTVPLDANIRWVRRWDLAATEKKQQGDPDWTAGVLMGRYPSGYLVIADVRRCRRDSGPVEQANTVEAFMRATAFEDQARLGRKVKIRGAQDPGAAGKALLGHYKRTVFAGFDFTGDPEGASGDKLARATPLANQVEAGNVTLVEGVWNYDFVEECVVGETQVFTSKGLKRADAVEVGDLLLTHRGRFRPVKETMTRHADDLVTLQAKQLHPVTLTANHPVLSMQVSASTGGPRHPLGVSWKPAGEVRLRDVKMTKEGYLKPLATACDALTFPVLSPDENLVEIDLRYWFDYPSGEFGESASGRRSRRWTVKDDGETIRLAGSRASALRYRQVLDHRFGRLCGLWLAEGSWSLGRAEWSFHEDEHEFHAEVRDTLADRFGTPSAIFHPKHGPHSTKVSASLRRLGRWFETFGIHAPNKRIPDWAWSAPAEFHRGLIAGWLDGDGDGVDKGRTSSPSLAWGLRLLATRLGIWASINGHDARGRSSQIGPHTCVSRYVMWTVDLREQREKAVNVSTEEHVGLWLKRKEPAPGAQVYNFHVEEDESYVTTGGTLHNCRAFNLGAHDDMVDAAANAYLDLAGLTKTKVKVLV